MSRIFPKFLKFWTEISDLKTPKDHKLTLKFLATFKDPAKTVIDKKTDSTKNDL